MLLQSGGRFLRLPAIANSLSRYASLTTAAMSAPGPVEFSIREKLTSQLQPSDLEITNDSWQHRHHMAMKSHTGAAGETHFSIKVVSEHFKGLKTMQRHRLVYATLSDELRDGVHALSLSTKTPEEIAAAKAT